MRPSNDSNDKQRKTWDLLIGISLVIFGCLRLFNQYQKEETWTFRSWFMIIFIAYGAFLVYRHFFMQGKDN
ncbi:hypothetical protein [Aquimarina brevivitae]|uniref:Uncharacterized protein n=1 Tax=Aquimarina brevivitae TaxID=323412 RepID=A0A4Q7P2C0_9FLAO|nr:hypothetical protein [Aquimarina brevivitae]RZS93530.1 hypothetical protein EV197_2110 [Aquimarina brevivitae]